MTVIDGTNGVSVDASADTPLLAVEGLTKHFGAAPAVRAVEDVSFTLHKGRVLGVVGESGSGKSTIGRLALRLIEPTAGTVRYAGQDLGSLGPRDLRRFRRHMQMIFQDPFASLNQRMTIGEALVEPIRLHRGLGRREALDEAGRLLERVGLTREHLGRYPRAFSGGQRQRVAIARALASNPGFIVADEPVSALDVSIQAEVLNLLQDLQRDLGLTLMFISHDLSVVELISDRVMVLYLGRVMELGSSSQLFSTPAHPYTAALMDAAPGARRAGERIVLSGEIPSPSAPPSGCVFRTRCPFAVADCAATVPPLREVAPDHWKACIRDDLAF
ncbi:ABC transporter ATP-binding protein [Phreatobacter sp. AB_2022a]|uniref:ABC transporter ATP-binding protein n=1 Tax=Phreatobacter sp. AB_2022a TaxID=3003134 RepID=UPI0022872D56|nr:oligopeptide/dipeptide ABC transporter ATP-binding protein [Phreatobacter sp. AB_2022a]MCZ0738044.1 ATP-binding cassette domain-containing protein [Phreatobacter sp. AB_2022a]